MTGSMLKWIAGGVIAVATIPAVSFARSHRPVQAAPAALMASGADLTNGMTTGVSSTKPAALSTSTKQKHKKHGKLHGSKAKHGNLTNRKHKVKSLSHKKHKHTNLHSRAKAAA